MADFNSLGVPVSASSLGGAISSTQSSNTPSGPQPGSGPNVGGSRGLAQTQGGTARSLSRAQFPGSIGGTAGGM